MLRYELVPSQQGSFLLAPYRTNRWGMWDREYELAPAPGAFRIAVVGSSVTMGIGVPQEQGIAALLENQLNREGAGLPVRKYEVLNFSVAAYGSVQKMIVVERKVFRFSPDAVMLMIHGLDRARMLDYIIHLLRDRTPMTDPYIRGKIQERGVQDWMEDVEIRRRLGPVVPDLLRRSLDRVAEVCRVRGTPVFAVIFPIPSERDTQTLAMSAQWAAEAGMEVLDLRGVYGNSPASSLTLSFNGRQDLHLNSLGHKIVADRLFELLKQHDFAARRPSGKRSALQ